jgi:hypothetical protein
MPAVSASPLVHTPAGGIKIFADHGGIDISQSLPFFNTL